jgi:hypothetical protein
MGLFEFLLGRSASNVEVLRDKIWMTQRAKLIGIRREIAERSNSRSAAILLVAHFQNVLEELKVVAAESPWNTPLMATLAENLSTATASRLILDNSATIDLIVAERHPMVDAEDKVIEFSKGLPCKCRVAYHLSLEDPVLKRFSGEWVTGVLKKLGMAEDESLESPLVTRRIRGAQEIYKREVIGNHEAHSAAEWMQLNSARADAK